MAPHQAAAVPAGMQDVAVTLFIILLVPAAQSRELTVVVVALAGVAELDYMAV
jgi:hypothetical protein